MTDFTKRRDAPLPYLYTYIHMYTPYLKLQGSISYRERSHVFDLCHPICQSIPNVYLVPIFCFIYKYGVCNLARINREEENLTVRHVSLRIGGFWKLS